VPGESEQQRSALTSRFQQMFPILSQAEIDRARQFGEVRRFRPGDMLCRAGRPSPGMIVILSGRADVVGRDALGRPFPLAEFARLIGATVEDIQVVPGRMLDDLGQLSGGPSVADVQAVDDVEALVVPAERIRALLVAEAELGERLLRSLILRRVALIEMGFGGPVLIGPLKLPD
jgi:thioredoxin reductase (NADPH)